jgi:hypothetical protein
MNRLGLRSGTTSSAHVYALQASSNSAHLVPGHGTEPPAFGTEDGAEAGHVKACTGVVEHSLEDLLHRCLEVHRWIRLSGQTETRRVGTVDLDVKELGQASRVEDLSAMFAAGNGGVAMPCRRSARMECYGRGDGRVPRSCTSFK